MTRKINFLLFLIAALLIAFILFGCQLPKIDAPWMHADSDAQDIGEKVSEAATKVTGTAGEIATAANEGRNATPPNVRPTLDPFWIRIIASAQIMLAQGDALVGVRKDIDTLRTEVQSGQKQLKDAMGALETEKSGRQKDNKDWEQKLAAANGQWERMFRTISWLAIVAIGISVTVGVLMHDFRVSIAGGAGGFAVVFACMIVGQIQHWLPWIAGGLLAIVVIWILIESWLRGSFKQAIRTTPVQDIADAISNSTTTAPTANV